MDIILLAILRSARELVEDSRITNALDEPRYASLRAIRDLYRTQVVVDEATDFSPLQLACMMAVSDPMSDSFVACGDFNQRITEWGSRSTVDLNWAIAKIEIRPINITYRHSRQLNELARLIAKISSSEAEEVYLPQHVDSDGFSPVLGKNLRDSKSITSWLVERITEIERITKQLPSVAILVNSEEEVTPTAIALNEALADHNIRAIACVNGLVVGQENDVRVFDVQHIKGLEFEAVFFLGIDQLAEEKPRLFDKFLYVGATRAATYLGITVNGSNLPKKISSLQSNFVEHW